MGERRVDELAAGMVLAEPAYSVQGLLLLPAGTALTERKIRVLKTWGVRRLKIQGEEAGPQHRMRSDDETLAGAEESAFVERFADVLDNDAMKEILRVAVALRRRRVAGRGEKDGGR